MTIDAIIQSFNSSLSSIPSPTRSSMNLASLMTPFGAIILRADSML